MIKKKRCPKCKKPMQKWGKNQSGSTRFYCKLCKITRTRKRFDLTQKYEKLCLAYCRFRYFHHTEAHKALIDN